MLCFHLSLSMGLYRGLTFPSLTCAGQRPLSAPVSGWPGCDDVPVGNPSSYIPLAPPPPSPPSPSSHFQSLRTGSWGQGGRCGEDPGCKVVHHYPGCPWFQCQSKAPLGCCRCWAPGDAGFSVVYRFYPEAPETCGKTYFWSYWVKLNFYLIVKYLK